MDAYEDIIHLPHHVSKKHPQMSRSNRAAQFAPFAALTGYEDAISETARRTNQKIVLDEDARALLDDRLRQICFRDEKVKVELTYFLKDERKDGGSYVTTKGVIKKIDSVGRVIVLVGGEVIFLDDVLDLKELI